MRGDRNVAGLFYAAKAMARSQTRLRGVALQLRLVLFGSQAHKCFFLHCFVFDKILPLFLQRNDFPQESLKKDQIYKSYCLFFCAFFSIQFFVVVTRYINIVRGNIDKY